jgi:hypothetical protein
MLIESVVFFLLPLLIKILRYHKNFVFVHSKFCLLNQRPFHYFYLNKK